MELIYSIRLDIATYVSIYEKMIRLDQIVGRMTELEASSAPAAVRCPAKLILFFLSATSADPG
jgi:hypothetical protein